MGFNGAADFHRRKYYPPATADLILLASMGPPIFIGGNRKSPQKKKRQRKLQWGRRFSSAEICRTAAGTHRRSRRFNGAADFHRRKYESRCTARDHTEGFNGAADFHRRKWRPVPRCTERGGNASMGPPIFIGGNAKISVDFCAGMC